MNPGRRRLILIISTILCAVSASLCVPVLDACTLWAVAGERAGHGGAMIAKNRDWLPEADEVRLTTLPNGRRVVGLYPIREGRLRSAVAGINEQGLVVVSASAGSVPSGERGVGEKGLTGKWLADFSTVEEVLADQGRMAQSHPVIYLVADRKRIAWIEIAPRSRFAVRTTDNGGLVHTNHYLDEKLQAANSRIGPSSAKRLERIGELLAAHPTPLVPGDFITFSRDRRDGPDEGIWRTGSKPDGERTLANWIISLPGDAPPELFIRLANPGEPQREKKVTLDRSFWQGPVGTIF